MAELSQERRQDNQLSKEDETEEKQEKEERINNVTAGLMVAVALLYDGVQMFLEWIGIGFIVNWILNIWAWLTFFVWFKLRGVSFAANPKRALAFNGGFLIEFIPIIEELPIWTAVVVVTVITVRLEDKLASISSI